MRRQFIFVYGVLCYAISLAAFTYAFGFLGNFWFGRSMDSIGAVPMKNAALLDLALVALFGVQHSTMARPAFKRWWRCIVPGPAERSTYLLFSSLALLALFVLWQPIGGVIWRVDSPVGRTVFYSAYGFGWGLLLFSSFLLNHFELFGLRQIWLQLLGKPHQSMSFQTPVLYRFVRHPLYVGWLFTFWAAPTMTTAHLVFALATSAYILIAIRFEERDLLAAHQEYADYRQLVPSLVPFTKRRRQSRVTTSDGRASLRY
jgi:protein-S-isoprenylcysteine O-methyltransferase Ste14